MAGKNEPKSGGRKKGTRNKRTEMAAQLFEDIGFEPILVLAELYNESLAIFHEIKEAKEQDGKKLSSYDAVWLQIAQSVAKDLMPYRYPKLKALEITTEDENGKVRGLVLAYSDPKKAKA